MTWSDIKAGTRLVVHETFGVLVQYAPPSGIAKDVTVRFHTKHKRFGDLDRQGYAEVIEDISQILFQKSEVTTVRLGVVTFPDGSRFRLDLKKEDEGDFAKWDVEQLPSA